ncbi:unnamed protein product [Clonostachys rosea]|uniref:Carrier domain-containing protein n=1 Tax=Bionectria ochroleuca TaxID=29856 RepID=A0ABY6UCS3_BIOOC|nr:unnamed protein product [Clonostachys rosea]
MVTNSGKSVQGGSEHREPDAKYDSKHEVLKTFHIDNHAMDKVLAQQNIDFIPLILLVWVTTLYHMTGSADVEFFYAAIHAAKGDSGTSTKRHFRKTLEASTTTQKLLNLIEAELKKATSTESQPESDKGAWKNEITIKIEDGHENNSMNTAQELQTNRMGYIAFVNHGPKSTELSVAAPKEEMLGGSDCLMQIMKGLLEKMTSGNAEEILRMDVTSNQQLDLRKAADMENSSNQSICIHDLVLESAAENPDAMAIAAWDGELTYRELDELSRSWARSISGLNYPPGSHILHQLKQSCSGVVAWIAIIRSGHVCVPVDWKLPSGRIGEIASDTGAQLVISDREPDESDKDKLPRILTPEQLTSLDDEETGCADLPKCDPNSTAVIIHTSGSTGKPKGVVQVHRAISNSLRQVADVLNFGQQTRNLHAASYSFDASLCEVLAPLTAGGCICIPEPGLPLEDFAKHAAELEVNAAQITPSMASLLSPETVPTLRQLALGGERADAEVCKKWFKEVDLKIIYGTTETRVWDSIATFDGANQSPANIGYAIGDPLWVVHPADWKHLSPIGVPGELCVGGHDIAQGYHNLDEKSNDRFKAAAPWLESSNCTSGIYRTGDMAKILADGSIELLGRSDRQIKIRGQRLEPAEVESHLKEGLPDDYSVYVDQIDLNGSKHLAAFVSHHKDSAPEVLPPSESDAVSIDLAPIKAALPSYMVPTHIIHFTAFPRTRTDKLDRPRLLQLASDYLEANQQTATGEELETGDTAARTNATVRTFLQEKTGRDLSELEGKNFVLRDFSLTSIDAPVLARDLRQSAGVDITSSVLLDDRTTINDLVSRASESDDPQSQQRHSSVELSQEVRHWDEKLEAICRAAPSTVLLTGATGFLGTELLRQMLTGESSIRVIALVRGKTIEEARDRVEKAAVEDGWWQASYREQLDIQLGDLASPHLGLDQQYWSRLFGIGSQEALLDFVVHNGARVDWSADYEALRHVNVNSIFEILNAQTASDAPPHVIFVSGGYLPTSNENIDSTKDKLSHMSGYDQTKFVSEQMISHFNELCKNPLQKVSTVKPGYIIGSSRTGRAQEGDAIWRLAKSCTQIGYYSKLDADSWVTVMDVESVASTILAPLTESNSTDRGRNIAITQGTSLRSFWEAFSELGFSLSALPHDEWLRRITASMEKDLRNHPLCPLEEWFKSTSGRIGGEYPERTSTDDGCAQSAIKASISYLLNQDFFSS